MANINESMGSTGNTVLGSVKIANAVTTTPLAVEALKLPPTGNLVADTALAIGEALVVTVPVLCAASGVKDYAYAWKKKWTKDTQDFGPSSEGK
jgi:hypothetical protein